MRTKAMDGRGVGIAIPGKPERLSRSTATRAVVRARRVASACAFTFSAATAGCAATRGLPPPVAPAEAEPPTQTCQVTAPPRVVAARVFAPEGVNVEAQGQGFAIRFAQTKSHCLTLRSPSAVAPFTGSDKSAACPERSGDIDATSDGETMLASESGDAEHSHVLLGVVTYDVPLAPGRALLAPTQGIAWHLFQPPPSVAAGGERSPKLVPLGDEHFLLLWVEGDSERHRLHAEPVAGWGTAAGPAIDVSLPEMDVIGRPDAAVGPSGEGVVAFLASGEHGFDVIATSIACGQGAAAYARASLPSTRTVARR